MPIHLYQSKKVQRYIGNKIYDDVPWAPDQVDPLTLWYADVFFIDRKSYLVIANPLTKMTFFVFRYSKKTHPDFMATFREKLKQTLLAADIDATGYLRHCDLLVPYILTDRSASSHISRTKIDFEYIIKSDQGMYDMHTDEAHYNHSIAHNFVTYNKKDYDYPFRRFHRELILRRWD
jgi:hypothetical protein